MATVPYPQEQWISTVGRPAKKLSAVATKIRESAGAYNHSNRNE